MCPVRCVTYVSGRSALPVHFSLHCVDFSFAASLTWHRGRSVLKFFWTSIDPSLRNKETVSMDTLRTLGVASLYLTLGIIAGCKAPEQTAAKAGDVTEARVASESAGGAS